MLLKIGDLTTYSHSAESSFSANVWIRCRKKSFDLRKEVPRHLNRSDISKCAEGKSDDILIRVIEVAITTIGQNFDSQLDIKFGHTSAESWSLRLEPPGFHPVATLYPGIPIACLRSAVMLKASNILSGRNAFSLRE